MQWVFLYTSRKLNALAAPQNIYTSTEYSTSFPLENDSHLCTQQFQTSSTIHAIQCISTETKNANKMLCYLSQENGSVADKSSADLRNKHAVTEIIRLNNKIC